MKTRNFVAMSMSAALLCGTSFFAAAGTAEDSYNEAFNKDADSSWSNLEEIVDGTIRNYTFRNMEDILDINDRSYRNKADVRMNNGLIFENKDNLAVTNASVASNKAAIESNTGRTESNRAAIDAAEYGVEKNRKGIKANSEAMQGYFNQANARMDSMEEEYSQGISMAMSMSAIPQATDGRNSVGIGTGYYNGEQSIAIGASSNFGDMNQHTVNFNIGLASDDNAAAIGYSYQW